MAQDPNKGFNALKQTASDIVSGLKYRTKGIWTSVAGATGNGAAASRGLIDRTAGAASTLLTPVKWIANSRILGTAAIIGGVTAGAIAVKNHYKNKREAVNAMGMDPSQMQYPSYANSVSPEEYAQMEARMRTSTGQQFAQAEAERRTAAAPTGQPQPGAAI
jgi:hypothetical protein